jgi:homospermidine synthase
LDALRACGIDVHLVTGCAIDGRADLAALLARTAATTLVDLAGLGTFDAVRICDAAGCRYLNACFDHWPGEEGPSDPEARRVMIAAQALHPSERPSGLQLGHVIGAGMNPGLVNALAARAFIELLRCAGLDAAPPTAGAGARAALVHALGVYALYVTEDDSSSWSHPSTDEFACSWHPRHCLEELLEAETMATDDARLVGLGHRPIDRMYDVRVGEQRVAGFVVPHDEIVTLSFAWPGLEMAYIYRPAPASRAALAAHPQRAAADWTIRRLYPPHDVVEHGHDTVGVLLCSTSLGELWIGFDNDVAQASAYHSNPTQLQVAAGVLAAWLELAGAPAGAWVMEELDEGRVLAAAQAVLGPVKIVWDRQASPRPLRSRRVAR